MSIKLQLRRGLEVNLPNLAEGEPGFCTDTYKLFIGSAAGNKGVAMLASPTFTGLVTIPDTLSAAVGPLRNARKILIHDFQHPTGGGAIPVGHNLFIGGAGNFTMGVTATATNHSSWNLGIGENVLSSNTRGYGNIGIGGGALLLNTTGYNNTALGDDSLQYNMTGYENTGLGSSALSKNMTGTGNLAIGACAGYWETGSNKLFIDNAARASEADGRIKALIYGIFDALTANQRVSLNARLLVRECPNHANNAAALAGGLVSGEFYTVTGTDPLQVARVI